MSRSPSLGQLRAFRLIMSTGGMTAAAKAQNLTQPALSKQIASLEETLGVRLFARRRGGPLAPTKEGIAFYKSIEGTLYGIEAIPEIAREIAQKVRLQVRIAATLPVIQSKPFMAALADFRAKTADVRISLASRPRIDLEDWVRNQQADISLGLLPSLHPDLRSKTLVETAAVAVLPVDHTLAARARITAEDLKSVPTILPSRQPLRDRIDASLPDLGCEIETSSSVTCVSLAVSQAAVALCDPLSPTLYPPGFVRVLPFEPHIPLSYGAILPRSAHHEPIVEALLDELGKHFGR